MNRNSIRHNIYAIILLMVMLLQVGIKTFHVHHTHASVKIECEDCDQHKVHDGHLIDWDGQSDDCMLCQLLTNPYVAAEEIRPDDVINHLCTQPQGQLLAVCQGQWQSIRQRGPPASLL